MVTQTDVNKLIIRKGLTREQYTEMLNNGEIGPNDLCFVDDDIDTTPQEDSDALITSGGVYGALEDKQDTLSAGTNISISNNVISTPSTVLNKVKNTIVQIADFVSDERYSGYKYRADVPVNGITSNDYPHVMFSIEDCVSNNYASFVESGNGYVSIWCKELPESAVTIPVITFE